MSGSPKTEIRLRFIVENPVPGVAYSLQDRKSSPVDAAVSKDGGPLAFEFPINLAAGPKLSGEFVRREGPERRFVYIAIGQQAGQQGTPWSRRMKIDIHGIPQTLLDKALKGKVLEAVIHGTGSDGTPACATQSPAQPWRAV